LHCSEDLVYNFLGSDAVNVSEKLTNTASLNNLRTASGSSLYVNLRNAPEINYFRTKYIDYFLHTVKNLQKCF
jgi:hypothetical protein